MSLGKCAKMAIPSPCSWKNIVSFSEWDTRENPSFHHWDAILSTGNVSHSGWGSWLTGNTCSPHNKTKLPCNKLCCLAPELQSCLLRTEKFKRKILRKCVLGESACHCSFPHPRPLHRKRLPQIFCQGSWSCKGLLVGVCWTCNQSGAFAKTWMSSNVGGSRPCAQTHQSDWSYFLVSLHWRWETLTRLHDQKLWLMCLAHFRCPFFCRFVSGRQDSVLVQWPRHGSSDLVVRDRETPRRTLADPGPVPSVSSQRRRCAGANSIEPRYSDSKKRAKLESTQSVAARRKPQLLAVACRFVPNPYIFFFMKSFL